MSYNKKFDRYVVFEWRGSFDDVHNREQFYGKYKSFDDVMYDIADATVCTDSSINSFESNNYEDAMHYFSGESFSVREGILGDIGWQYRELFDMDSGDVITPDEIQVFHETYSRDQRFDGAALKATARVIIDIDEFLSGDPALAGMIDGSAVAREPCEIMDAGVGPASPTARLNLEGGCVVLEYEYNPGDEDARIEAVDFQGRRYPCTGDFYAPECYKALVSCLKAD